MDELILDMSKTYIYEGLEYILTGRTAKKREDASALPQRRSKRTAARAPKIVPMMVEIQLSPKRTAQHPEPPSTERKWVELNDLYMIDDMLDEPDEPDIAEPDEPDVDEPDEVPILTGWHNDIFEENDDDDIDNSGD